ncbi:hypothetical protein KGA66_26990 [Actinocrinis puniceicyclus]|uniref:Uncharacterized protein n=1 Tax=Actinocrinis puniceicyclus TaxID=977794 RepID=A0A8J8BDY5_9ACTN|nr:hypothetical protein [Actinocrinis puniceicyclus]
MRDRIEQPVAYAVVSWLSAEQGGRRSGPPTAPVYMATAVFPLGGERETQPGWPATADKLSVLLQETPGTSDGGRIYKVDFLVRDLARPFLHPGAKMLVTEGPKVVASAVIREVRPENSAG